jgi:hypothetical protein
MRSSARELRSTSREDLTCEEHRPARSSTTPAGDGFVGYQE